MNELKFRYTVKRTNGHIFSETFPMKDIVNGYVKRWFKNNNIGGSDEIFREQYTTKKDYNGKKIFIGDKVESVKTRIVFEIIFNEEDLCFQGITPKGIYILSGRNFFQSKIICNIHEAVK